MSLDVPIKKIMTSQVVSVSEDTSLQHIGELFKAHDFHHLPVVGSDNQVLGIISREDFSKVAYQIMTTAGETQQKDALKIMAGNIMTKKPVSMSMYDKLGSAIEVFLQNKIRAIIIQDEGGTLKGILSAYDALSFLYQVVASREIFKQEAIKEAEDDWDWETTWDDFF